MPTASVSNLLKTEPILLKPLFKRYAVAVFAALSSALPLLHAESENKKVVFQFASYYSEKSTDVPNPWLATHIIFSPARINDDFTLLVKYPNMLRRVADLKKVNPKLKVMLLIGGSKSKNFSEAASNKENRSKLLDEFELYMEKYGLDGIDLDWEAPTLSRPDGQTGKPEDIDNYTALMREFKERFPDKILSVDVGNRVEHIDFANAQKYADYFNLMSYDYSSVNHNSPLYLSNLSRSRICVSDSVEKLMKLVPARKIVMGIPFYGHLFLKGKNGEMLSYKSLERIVSKFKLTPCRDEIARVPFYVDTKREIVAACEDPQSVREKCAYAKSKNLAGVMCWQFLDDDKRLTLSRAVAEEMNKD